MSASGAVRGGELDGQVVVVTGAAGGLGSTIFAACAQAGARVVGADLNEDRMAKLTDAERGRGHTVLAVPTDITDSASVRALVGKTVAAFGQIHVLINAAGITRLRPALEFLEQDWDDIIRVNLKGVFLCCQAVGQQMAAQGGGRIINISSVAGEGGLTHTPAYCASKGGVNMLTKALAIEWAKSNILVNAIAPSWLRTEMGDLMHVVPGLSEARLARVPMGRLGLPEEVVTAVLFLASPWTTMVTGLILAVDGGYLAQ